MVVVNGTWVKNVATYPTPVTENNDVISSPNNNNNNNMSAKAILISRPNSHPFQERTLTLDQPVKIGRSVARVRATSTNAIFDCKVLSRHHAVLWYENGKFFLQDTKSSNGTFVNNTRLSSSEAEAHEVSSGDIVQFGVDVVENNRKVTHGCIIATLKLYLPDGKEAKASPSITESRGQGTIPLDELYRLNQIIQEASQRELCLEKKLCSLQNIVEAAKKSADESWQAFIGEERLLSRVAILENQLQQAAKSFADDKLKEELSKLLEEKNEYQLAVKQTLCKLHTERLHAVALATEQESARNSIEREATFLKEQFSQLQQELQEVAQKLTEQQKVNDLLKQDMEEKLETEQQAIKELKAKLEQLNSNPLIQDGVGDELKKEDVVCKENGNIKEDILTELENCDNKVKNESVYFDINSDCKDLPYLALSTTRDVIPIATEEADSTYVDGVLSSTTLIEEDVNNKNKFVISQENESNNQSPLERLQEMYSSNGLEVNKNEEKDFENDNVDSNTLKYQLVLVQKQMSKRVEELEEQVSYHILYSEKMSFELKKLQEEHKFLQENWEIKRAENGKLLETVSDFQEQLDFHKLQISQLNEEKSLKKEGISFTPEFIACLEEELVLLKERCADLIEEKMSLNKELTSIENKYRDICNKTYNKMFFYIAPLVVMIVYLLFTSIFS